MSDQQLDFSGRTQLYYQLYDILYDDIHKGIYKPGDLLPTENELISKYHISRVTVRKAMDMLMNDGMIGKRRGYGTFVLKEKMGTELDHAQYFATTMIERGFTPFVKVLSNKKILASKSVAEALGVPDGTPVVHLRRLRLADETPIRMESTHLLYEKYAMVEKHDFTNSSLREFLRENYNVSWATVQQKIYAIAADARHAKILDISEGTPTLYSECVFYTSSGEPGEYSRVYHRADSNFFSLQSVLQY